MWWGVWFFVCSYFKAVDEAEKSETTGALTAFAQALSGNWTLIEVLWFCVMQALALAYAVVLFPMQPSCYWTVVSMQLLAVLFWRHVSASAFAQIYSPELKEEVDRIVLMADWLAHGSQVVCLDLIGSSFEYSPLPVRLEILQAVSLPRAKFVVFRHRQSPIAGLPGGIAYEVHSLRRWFGWPKLTDLLPAGIIPEALHRSKHWYVSEDVWRQQVFPHLLGH
jgi:hypothetical protein